LIYLNVDDYKGPYKNKGTTGF